MMEGCGDIPSSSREEDLELHVLGEAKPRIIKGVVTVEQFLIKGEPYGIDREGDGFRFWKAGGALGTAPTIEEARKLLHGWIRQQITVERDNAIRTYSLCKDTLAGLGDDPFYLGRFLK